MKNKYKILGCLLILGSILIGSKDTQAASLSTDGLQAQTSITKITSIQELNTITKIINERIKQLKKGNIENKTGENLTISKVALLYPNGSDYGITGNVMDQKIMVTIRNNEFAPLNLTGEKIKYEIYLYDVTTGKNKLFKAATGMVDVPYRNGNSEFSAFIQGGLPFDGKNSEKKYRALIKIDTAKTLKESNEKDNELWSDEWLITYYKG